MIDREAVDAVMICVGYDVRSGTGCDRDAVDEVIAGCVHEHIGTRALCQYHIADLAEERMVCGDCRDCNAPHRCILSATPARSPA